MSATSSCWCGGRVDVDICLDSQFHDPAATGRPVEVSRLYLAGPMSGIADNNYPEFNRVAGLLEAEGYEVVNPAKVHLPGVRVHYTDLIREDLRQMLDCHGVAVLDDWWESVGARNEVQVAGVLKMAVKPWQQWAIETRRDEVWDPATGRWTRGTG